MQKRICIISQYYPDDNDMILSFVDQLVCQFADMDCICDVITPVSIFERNHIMKSRVRKTRKGNTINIWCPKYVSVPHRIIAGFDTYRITMKNFFNAVYKTFRRHIKTCDAIYSHFINPSGICAALLSDKTGINAFVACGESSFDSELFAIKLYKNILHDNLSGIISVSSEIKRKLIEMDLISDNSKIQIIPNAVDFSEFPVVDKKQLRKEFGLSDNDFIVSFVGHFIARKGLPELLSAAEMSKGTWKCIFIGNGPISVNYSNTLYCGPVSHENLYRYLEVSDVFVLPTKAEGCCNAIIEAMVCGLPIVSSNLPFNDDILDDSFSIRIDPNDVLQIFSAVSHLKDVNYRNQMSINAKLESEKYELWRRAEKILFFMGLRKEKNFSNEN